MPPDGSIEELLILFLRYKDVRIPAERVRLEQQILRLFDVLGASLSPAVRDVRQEFDTMRGAEFGASSERQPRSLAKQFSMNRIARFRKLPDSVKLTPGAQALLRIPIEEAFELAEFRSAQDADSSLRLVAQSLREQPRSPSEGHGRVRTSIAVIRAYAKNFCNIPPFCTGDDNE